MLLKEDLIMVDKKLLFSRIRYMFLFFLYVVFFNVSFFRIGIAAENLYTSGGAIDIVDVGRLVINDSNFQLSDTIEYLDEKGGHVEKSALKVGDLVIFQASTDRVIFQIKSVSSFEDLKFASPERVERGVIDSREPKGQQEEFKFKNGVWTN